MKSLITITVAIMTFAWSNAYACSVLPLDVDKAIEQYKLADLAVTALGTTPEFVENIEVTNKTGDYIWTPMCPRGNTVSAEFTVTFDEQPDDFWGPCTGSVKIKRTYARAEGNLPSINKIDIEITQSAMCLE